MKVSKKKTDHEQNEMESVKEELELEENIAQMESESEEERETVIGEGEDEEEEEEERETEGGIKKTVLVGIKMDSQSRELLTWALVNLALPNDQFIACHVISSSLSNSSRLAEELDSMLSVYDGFCHLKQIKLKLKICKGLSIRRALVREAKNFKANTLILGVPHKKYRHSIGSWLTYPKYCAKKLSSSCSIIAVSNGKIVFQTEITEKSKSKSDESSTNKSELYCLLPDRLNRSTNSISNRSMENTKENSNSNLNPDLNSSMNDLTDLPTKEENSELYCVLPIKSPGRPIKSTNSISNRSMENAKENSNSNSNPDLNSSTNDLTDLPTKEENSELYCVLPIKSLARPNIEQEETDLCCSWPRKGDLSSISNSSTDSSSNSNSNSNFGLTLTQPNCSVCSQDESHLLRKRILTHNGNNTNNHKRSHSLDWPMVKFAMRFPNRYKAVYLDRKSDKLSCCDSGSESGPSVSSPYWFKTEREWPTEELERLKEKCGTNCRSFDYEELRAATLNFSMDKLVGKGGTSRVYRANLKDGKDLAVKLLTPSDEAVREFISEIEIATSLHHKNIISLSGFCFENNSLILVYEYLSNGSLEDILHGEREKKQVLGWAERYRIAIGIAEALDYLHESGTHQSVIHGDVKSSNILLSHDFIPQLSDFGLAKRVSSQSSNLTCTDIAGTFGYLAPEYFMYGKVNEKIDVYAYGVVLLELISGRKPIKTGSPKGHESLVVWAKPILQSGNINELVDPSLSNIEYNSEQMERMGIVALLCLRTYYQSRPQMSLVVKLLKGDEEAIKWAKSQINSNEEGFDGSDSDELITPGSSSNIQSYLNLALLDLDEDSVSIASTEQTIDSISVNASIEDYLERWSRSSSFE